MSEQRSLARATIGALGVVYGDIGTSPLYALKEATAAAGGATDAATVLGVLSLIFWSLFLVITLKYIVLILRSDNAGEGGILSLLALVQQKLGTTSVWAGRFVAIAALGTALFYCDALITPAISVLSRRRRPRDLESRVLAARWCPITLVIITALFLFQRRGTARVGGMFGPIMVVWFTTLGVLGVLAIVREPRVLEALFPGYRDRAAARVIRASRSRSSAPCSSRSRAARRCTPTWVTSARSPCGSRGSCSSGPGCCSTISARAPLLLGREQRDRESVLRARDRPRRCRSSSCSRRPRRSSRRRRTFRARSRSRARPCSSICCRA